MIPYLRLFFLTVLLSMLAVTAWAGGQVALWNIPGSVGGHPWFVATLFDAYWGFFTFYLWLAYREEDWLSRALWLVAIVLLGNIAMAVYGLAVSWRLPADARPQEFLLRSHPLPRWIPAALIGALAAICAAFAFL